jgi:glycosyltransferase involved in cell wall biosynthesis
MKFSIITPSFRSSRWLKLCIPSVADQGVEHEHIVQDSCSDDGTQDWLPRDPRIQAFIEKDKGMYDAINRGLRRGTGDIMAYLNCDEQYLPGGLAAVERFFEQHPDYDIVFGDAVVTRPDGSYICHRRAVRPTKLHTQISGTLAILSCGAFFRRRFIEEKQVYFNTQYRGFGDAHWVLSLIEKRARMGFVRQFTSGFTNTGDNLSLDPKIAGERESLVSLAPPWARNLQPAVAAEYRFRKLLAGDYTQKPFDYAIYTPESPDKRVVFHVDKPTAVWKWQA